MKLFVIHRFRNKNLAKAKLKKVAKDLSLKLQLIILDSSGGNHWKQKALDAMGQCEAVIIFDPLSCEESDNAKWEIEKAKLFNKEIIEFSNSENNDTAITKLKFLYDLKDEFENCFTSDNTNDLELYKLMIASSESLIQRRQKTNAFFITAIGSLLAIAGLLVKTGAINGKLYGIFYGFSVIGLLLCNSWRNLIDNYGKLNKAKFDVILRLEKRLSAQIYSAEWIALGKGLRPSKYKSFTSTEKNVPFFFGLLIVVLTLVAAGFQIWG